MNLNVNFVNKILFQKNKAIFVKKSNKIITCKIAFNKKMIIALNVIQVFTCHKIFAVNMVHISMVFTAKISKQKIAQCLLMEFVKSVC